jgi:hypothetical protein
VENEVARVSWCFLFRLSKSTPGQLAFLPSFFYEVECRHVCAASMACLRKARELLNRVGVCRRRFSVPAQQLIHAGMISSRACECCSEWNTSEIASFKLVQFFIDTKRTPL